MDSQSHLNALVGDPFEFNNALQDLEQFSLIRRERDGGSLSIHRLVQTVIRANLPDQDKRRVMEMAVELFLAAFPLFQEDERQRCRKYQTQVVGPLLTVIEIDTEESAEILIRVGGFLYEDGKYQDGKHFARKAVEILTLLFGPEDDRTMAGMNELAAIYKDLGQIKEAADIAKKALDKWRRTLGDEHPFTLSSMNNLARIYFSLGRAKEAADMFKKVMDKWRRTLGDEHPDTLKSM